MKSDTTTTDQALWASRLHDTASAAYSCSSCEGSENWYYTKSSQIRALAARTGYSIAEATAAYAVLSANASVLENDRNFVRVMLGHESVGFGSRQKRVDLALSGLVAEAIDYINGEKIPSFFDNLFDPFTSTAVTIDRHAADIVTLDRKVSKRILARAHREGYHAIADVYRAVAARMSVRPHELQARVWVHHTTCTKTTSGPSARARKVAA